MGHDVETLRKYRFKKFVAVTIDEYIEVVRPGLPIMPESLDAPDDEVRVALIAEVAGSLSPGSQELIESKPVDRMKLKARRLFGTMLLFEMGLGCLALAIGYWLESPSWRTWDWSARAWGFGVLGTIPPLILLVVMLRAKWDPLARFRTLLEQRVAPIFATFRWWQLLLLAAAAGWGEEMLFRGLLQPLLCQWLGALGGIVLLGGIFGLAHALSRLYFALTLVMSMYLSWLLEVTGNLAVPVLVHGLYDAVALLIMQKDD